MLRNEMLWFLFLAAYFNAVLSSTYPECILYNKVSGQDAYLIAEDKPTFILEYFSRLRKIYMSSRYEEQGVWQIIPVEGKPNVFYLRNIFFQENLFPKYKHTSKSNQREIYLWPKDRSQKERYPEEFMWRFDKLNEYELKITNLYYDEPLYVDKSFWGSSHNVYTYHYYFFERKDSSDNLRWTLKCRNQKPIII